MPSTPEPNSVKKSALIESMISARVSTLTPELVTATMVAQVIAGTMMTPVAVPTMTGSIVMST